jgi:hypothetical protein
MGAGAGAAGAAVVGAAKTASDAAAAAMLTNNRRPMFRLDLLLVFNRDSCSSNISTLVGLSNRAVESVELIYRLAG